MAFETEVHFDYVEDSESHEQMEIANKEPGSKASKNNHHNARYRTLEQGYSMHRV